MNLPEIVCITFGTAFAIVVAARLWLWARRQVRLAEALTRRGWIIVGCPFWTGPDVRPPAGKTAPEIRADIAAAFQEVGVK